MKLIASAVTLIAIPIWFFASIAVLKSQSENVNNASIQAYFMISVMLAFPTALMAGFVAGPLAAVMCKRRLWASVVLSMLCLAFTLSLFFIAGWFFSLLPRSAGWILLPYTTLAFVGPPLFLGTTVFTVLNCRLRSPIRDGG